MYRVSFKPSFIRQARKLEQNLFLELVEKIELLKIKDNHSLLRVHKLHGEFSDCYGFSISHKVRVIFKFESKNEITLLVVGNRGIYKSK